MQTSIKIILIKKKKCIIVTVTIKGIVYLPFSTVRFKNYKFGRNWQKRFSTQRQNIQFRTNFKQ